ncbi:polygalacturonase-like [Melia azedarach]|uniref:Polygalacturonase-like n=1 Tax=Melia azedarach TaxID=155640 RepID=A0ACC1YMM0_MELAZ|nr:polygalacturonase-like [Melia azedarach]
MAAKAFYSFFYPHPILHSSIKRGVQCDKFWEQSLTGKTDSTQSFLQAWAAACSSVKASTISVPAGRFLVKTAVFRGPCKNKITVQIKGTIVAPSDYRAIGNSEHWILFVQVDGVSVLGGTLDAQGAGFWACRKSGQNCPVGARSITFSWANNVIVNGLTSMNSQLSHRAINNCKNVIVRKAELIAPADSPNTDGIHIQTSTGVTITGSTLQTGDDCISIGQGTRNLYMSSIKCGPGHGVSIGSLGQELNEDGVENVTLTDSVFTGSDNGVRIKSWARPSKGFVRGVLFQNLIMKNVESPIIIDQNYCPHNQGCPSKTSGVKISEVKYKNIQGTSATPEAVTFDCSPSSPCTGITLQDIKLTYMNKAATSSCKNIGGTSGGVLMPESCISSRS